ncbi:unnamed protein product [Arabidopsis thaliana]|uniref:Uncharacterized protein n=2 Tax=Arabidopsis TaxID=3701 RepID=A0A654FLQ8_ARATH|nr:hypothetical protein ISN44_As04g004700 [Arabidopsis suecica]VYS61790.1 unnamed protein product [Arabidopsis thaliana]
MSRKFLKPPRVSHLSNSNPKIRRASGLLPAQPVASPKSYGSLTYPSI